MNLERKGYFSLKACASVLCTETVGVLSMKLSCRQGIILDKAGCICLRLCERWCFAKRQWECIPRSFYLNSDMPNALSHTHCDKTFPLQDHHEQTVRIEVSSDFGPKAARQPSLRCQLLRCLPIAGSPKRKAFACKCLALTVSWLLKWRGPGMR